ncbi:MAG: hypothetical protein ACK559_08175, partial [bacterium]
MTSCDASCVRLLPRATPGAPAADARPPGYLPRPRPHRARRSAPPMAGPVLLLGPQRPHPNLPAALAAHGIRGPVAVLTAGWRHDEPGVEALARAIPNPLVHLPIYRWFDEILAEAPGFQAAYS